MWWRTSKSATAYPVQDVVHARRQTVDVLPVERGDERGVQGSHDLMGDLVAFVLALSDLRVSGLGIAEIHKQLAEHLRGLRHVRGRPVEQFVEVVASWDHLEPWHSALSSVAAARTCRAVDIR